jgi:hypothetical protein
MEGFLVIVAIYVVLTVVGAMQKKQREEQRRRQQMLGSRPGPSSAEEPAAGLSVLQRALRELQRVEAEAKAAQRPGALAGESDLDEEATGDAGEGQEDVLSSEAVNLDDESVRTVEERQRGYDVVERAAVAPVRTLPAPSVTESRIVSRIVTTLSVAEESAASEATQSAPTRRGSPLARFATGRVGDAIVLSEIVGRPVSDRGSGVRGER